MNVDFFMKEAIIEADKAYNLNEVPVGGILVDNTTNNIVARSYNTVNKNKNAIKHCELNLIQETCERLKLKYLENMTLFVTLEPCTMVAPLPVYGNPRSALERSSRMTRAYPWQGTSASFRRSTGRNPTAYTPTSRGLQSLARWVGQGSTHEDSTLDLCRKSAGILTRRR